MVKLDQDPGLENDLGVWLLHLDQYDTRGCPAGRYALVHCVARNPKHEEHAMAIGGAVLDPIE